MVEPRAKAMTEKVTGGAPFKVGDRVKRPDGVLVEIVDGQYWGTHGLSNHWSWRRVLPNGNLCAATESGYGWTPPT